MKLFIAIFAICALVAGAFVFAKKFLKKKPKAEKEELTEEEKTAQSLVELAGFKGHCALTTTGNHVIFISVDGKNNLFATDQEKDINAERLAIALGGERHPYTIHRVQKPVDTTLHLASLDKEIQAIEDEIYAFNADETIKRDFAFTKQIKALSARKELLETIYRPQCTESADSSNAKFVTETYITMSFSDVKDLIRDAERIADGLIRRLEDAGYSAKKMEPDQIVETLTNYFSRYPVSTENTNQFDLHIAA